MGGEGHHKEMMMRGKGTNDAVICVATPNGIRDREQEDTRLNAHAHTPKGGETEIQYSTGKEKHATPRSA